MNRILFNSTVCGAAMVVVSAYAPFVQAAQPNAGRFEFVVGDVRLKTRAGAESPVTRGQTFAEGDTITSGAPGYAQMRFTDEGIVVLRANTVMRIEKYSYKQENSKEAAHLVVEKGGMRAITGKVGSVNKDDYRISTPMAQMGVRGTDHETIVIPLPVGGELTTGAPGTYNKVNTGGTYMANEAGRVDINPAQAGRIADAKSQPQVLAQIPPVYLSAGGGKNERRFIQVDADGGAGPVIRPVTSNDGILLSPASLQRAGVTSFSATGAQTAVNAPFSNAGATLRDTGNNPALGVDWGRWDNAGIANNGVNNNQHTINTSQPTSASQLAALPGNGVVTATYIYAGQGTKPTNELGQTGALVSATAIANFTTQQMTGFTLNAVTPGKTWNVTGSGSFAQFGSNNGIALSGFCGGCTTTAATGRASGQFAGTQAQGILTGYGAQSGTSTVTGAALLTR